jgi:alpha-amylase
MNLSIQKQTVRHACAALLLTLSAALQAHAPVDLSPVPAKLVPSALPEGWQHGAFMEIFVRSWRDSDGDGIGDLKGLTQTLDHLQKLGISPSPVAPMGIMVMRPRIFATLSRPMARSPIWMS